MVPAGLVLLAASVAAGSGMAACAGAGAVTTTRPDPTRAAPPRRALDDAIAHWDSPGPAGSTAARVHARTESAPQDAPSAVARYAADPPRAAPRSARARVDVTFHEADLGDALRLLGDTARVPIVVDASITGTVSLALRGVDPLRALEIVAQTHGAAVDWSDGAAIVRPR